MKRIIKKAPLLTGILLLTVKFASAQEPEPIAKMSNYLEVSYGPRTILNFNTFNTSSNDKYLYDFNHVSNPGIFGIRYDRLLNPAFSLGIDFYYLQKRSTGTMVEFPSGTQNQAEYTINRFKTQVRVAYHFPISNPDLDVYLGGGIGMNAQHSKLLINGKSASREEYPMIINFPVSLRSFFGLRYSFTKHFGMNAEIGIGGSLINAGFHVRF